ncbi:MAG: hypothetical protein HYW48_09075 [Deltaproteobacteria bacterium]|nr:hypothetical protein [Deltaproteobacteria bacterium]
MRKRKIIIVDDDPDYKDGLKEFLAREAEVVAYESPDDFAEHVKRQDDLRGVSLIVLDYCFDTFNALDKDLLGFIREDLQYKGKLVLWSLEDDIPQEYRKRFDGVLPKKLLSLAEIDQCLETTCS